MNEKTLIMIFVAMFVLFFMLLVLFVVKDEEPEPAEPTTVEALL